MNIKSHSTVTTSTHTLVHTMLCWSCQSNMGGVLELPPPPQAPPLQTDIISHTHTHQSTVRSKYTQVSTPQGHLNTLLSFKTPRSPEATFSWVTEPEKSWLSASVCNLQHYNQLLKSSIIKANAFLKATAPPRGHEREKSRQERNFFLGRRIKGEKGKMKAVNQKGWKRKGS